MQDELLPLVMKRLAGNVATLPHGIANMMLESRYVARQLHRDARDKLASMSDVSAASREEEAGPQALLVEVFTGDGPRNRRLPCASHAVQPEYAAVQVVSAVSPVVYLLEKVGAGIGKAEWVVLSLICVEWSVRGSGQGLEQLIKS